MLIHSLKKLKNSEKYIIIMCGKRHEGQGLGAITENKVGSYLVWMASNGLFEEVACHLKNEKEK